MGVRDWFSRQPAVPEWAAALSSAEYLLFMATVQGEMNRRELRCEISEGWIRIHTGDVEPRRYGLVNLAQMCKHADTEEWRALIRYHFETLLERPDGDALERPFDELRALVKVRLYDAGIVANLPEKGPIHRPWADGIEEVLVLDLPRELCMFPSNRVDAWRTSAEQLFRLGLENVRCEERIESHTVESSDGLIDAVSSVSLFATSRALFFEEYVGPDAKYGALLAVPHRHTLLYHRIKDERAPEALMRMVLAAQALHHEGPGSISPHVYWWRPGRVLRIPARVQDNEVDLFAPDEFVEGVLKPLAAEGS